MDVTKSLQIKIRLELLLLIACINFHSLMFHADAADSPNSRAGARRRTRHNVAKILIFADENLSNFRDKNISVDTWDATNILQGKIRQELVLLITLWHIVRTGPKNRPKPDQTQEVA